MLDLFRWGCGIRAGQAEVPELPGICGRTSFERSLFLHVWCLLINRGDVARGNEPHGANGLALGTPSCKREAGEGPLPSWFRPTLTSRKFWKPGPNEVRRNSAPRSVAHRSRKFAYDKRSWRTRGPGHRQLTTSAYRVWRSPFVGLAWSELWRTKPRGGAPAWPRIERAPRDSQT